MVVRGGWQGRCRWGHGNAPWETPPIFHWFVLNTLLRPSFLCSECPYCRPTSALEPSSQTCWLSCTFILAGRRRSWKSKSGGNGTDDSGTGWGRAAGMSGVREKRASREASRMSFLSLRISPRESCSLCLGGTRGQPALCWPLVVAIPELVARFRKEQRKQLPNLTRN